MGPNAHYIQAMAPIFENTYARLPDRFFARLAPTPVSAPKLVKLNRTLALELGLDPDELSSPEGVAMLAGNSIAEGSEPIAQAYAGHQFGNFTPQLGDARSSFLDRKRIIRDALDRRFLQWLRSERSCGNACWKNSSPVKYWKYGS